MYAENQTAAEAADRLADMKVSESGTSGSEYCGMAPAEGPDEPSGGGISALYSIGNGVSSGSTGGCDGTGPCGPEPGGPGPGLMIRRFSILLFQEEISVIRTLLNLGVLFRLT